ncbi:MAG: hypothetical protein AB7S38_28890 [Vulcanimicrobiota bacterium]
MGAALMLFCTVCHSPITSIIAGPVCGECLDKRGREFRPSDLVSPNRAHKPVEPILCPTDLEDYAKTPACCNNPDCLEQHAQVRRMLTLAATRWARAEEQLARGRQLADEQLALAQTTVEHMNRGDL